MNLRTRGRGARVSLKPGCVVNVLYGFPSEAKYEMPWAGPLPNIQISLGNTELVSNNYQTVA